MIHPNTTSTRVVPDADRGGFLILHNGATYWANSFPLALAMSDAIRAEEMSR